MNQSNLCSMNWTNKQKWKKNQQKSKSTNITFSTGYGTKFSAIFIFGEHQNNPMIFNQQCLQPMRPLTVNSTRPNRLFSLTMNFQRILEQKQKKTTTKHGHWCERCLNYTWSFRCETVLCLHSQSSSPFIQWIVHARNKIARTNNERKNDYFIYLVRC